MNEFKFSDHIGDFKNQGVFLAEIKKDIRKKEELFDELKRKLIFPDYFGRNWDALNDCMNSLDWINEEKIVIFHEELPRISEKELLIYLNILIDTVNFYIKNGIKKIEIVFPEKDQRLVDSYLREL